MPPFDLSQSPQQAQMGQSEPVSPEEAFREGFSQMANDALGKQSPELMPDVVTFRCLSVDPDAGKGVGAFVIMRDDQIYYAPVMVSDSQLKPIDMFYSRQLDRYYPLSNEWLREASKSSLGTSGGAVEPPKTLRTDMDIRSLVIPPTTGRYSYAAARVKAAHQQLEDIAYMFASAMADESKYASDSTLLPHLMSRAPEAVKIAFRRVLDKNVKLAHRFIEVYGKDATKEMLFSRPKTAASTEVPMKHDLYVLDKSMPLQEVKKIVGEGVGLAYKAMRQYGFYVHDTRKDTNELRSLAMVEQDLVEPAEPGLYTVYTSDGPKRAMVLSDIKAKNVEKRCSCLIPHGRSYSGSEYLVVFENGDYQTVRDRLVARPDLTASYDDVRDFLSERLKEAPKNNENGSFICLRGSHIRATMPGYVTNVSDDATGTRCRFNYGTDIVLGHGAGLKIIQSGGTTLLPAAYQWLSLNDDSYSNEKKLTIYTSPEQIFRATEELVAKNGGRRVEVSSFGSDFKIANFSPCNAREAITLIGRTYGLRMPEIVLSLKVASSGAPYRLYAGKFAAEETEEEAPPAIDPSMLPPEPPPPPSGFDLAMMETLEKIKMQIAALNDKAQTLQELQGRAAQIDSGGGAMAAPIGAAAMQGGSAPVPGMPDPSQGMMDPSMMGGMYPSQGQYMPGAQSPMMDAGMQQQQMGGMDPSQGMMDPSMMGGDPSMMGGDPSMMGGDPSMMGMDPSQQQAPPPPRMDESTLRPGDIESQINPRFLQDVGQLEDDQVFDVAAVAQLAKQKNLMDLTTAYVPNLEKALDNLGRLRIQLAIRENDYKEAIGNDRVALVDQLLSDTFKNLGETVLQINQLSEETATVQ